MKSLTYGILFLMISIAYCNVPPLPIITPAGTSVERIQFLSSEIVGNHSINAVSTLKIEFSIQHALDSGDYFLTTMSHDIAWTESEPVTCEVSGQCLSVYC